MTAIEVNQLDRVICVPASLCNVDTHVAASRLRYGEDCWSIRHGVAKLRRKYSEYPHSREFDGYAAGRLAQDPAWRDRIEMADLLVTWLMQSQIERRRGAIEAVMEHRAGIETELARVPDNLALEGDISEQDWAQLESLFRAFRVQGVGLATMTKVLCMKRPALIPMMDSHVMGFLFERGWPRQGHRRLQDDAIAGVVGMKQFRALMLHGDNLKVLTTIRGELSPWLAGLEVSSCSVPAPSHVRLLDSLLWYDWNGYTYFGRLEEDLSVSALVIRLTDTDHAVRWRAAEALGNADPPAREAVPALRAVLNDKCEGSLVRWKSRQALERIERPVATAGAP